MAEVGLKSNNISKVKKISFIKKEDGKVNLPITILLIICSLTILFSPISAAIMCRPFPTCGMRWRLVSSMPTESAE